jgi:hypothetical protein
MGRFSVALARELSIFPRGRICWKTGLKVVSVGAAVAVQARGLVRTTADVLRGQTKQASRKLLVTLGSYSLNIGKQMARVAAA